MSSLKRKPTIPNAANASLLINASNSMHKNVRRRKTVRRHKTLLHPSNNQLNINAKKRLSVQEMEFLQVAYENTLKYVEILRTINMSLHNGLQEIKKLTNNVHLSRRKYEQLQYIEDQVADIAYEMEDMRVDILYFKNEIKNHPILQKMKVLYNEYRGLYDEIQDNIEIIYEYSANHLKR